MKKLMLGLIIALTLTACDDINQVAYNVTITDCKIEKVESTGGKSPSYYITVSKGSETFKFQIGETTYQSLNNITSTTKALGNIIGDNSNLNVDLIVAPKENYVQGIAFSKNRK
jgi:hypothetical protein